MVDPMTSKISHKILCQSKDLDTAQHYVSQYFKQSMLLSYDSFHIDLELSYCATADEFWQEAEAAIQQNEIVLTSYINELRDSGCTNIKDLETLSSGYQSKLIHLIAHLVDGFIGIDSHFFSLPEDSHWISKAMKERITEHPEEFWLIHLAAQSHSLESTVLLHHRPQQ